MLLSLFHHASNNFKGVTNPNEQGRCLYCQTSNVLMARNKEGNPAINRVQDRSIMKNMQERLPVTDNLIQTLKRLTKIVDKPLL